MSIHFHSLTIKRLVKETPDCVSVCFEVPESLKTIFAFTEGQNLTIKKKIGEEEVRRSYSICNAPHEGALTVAIKKIEGGLFSSFANDSLQAGDTLEVMPPSGKFNAHLQSNGNGNYLAIAAGSGITPILSIIKHTLHQQPNSRFTLVYGNKNRGSIIFFEELEALKNQYMNRFTFINVLSQEKMDATVLYGRIDSEKLSAFEKIIPYTEMNAAYLCGPEAMIFAAKDFLTNKGMSEKAIHFELFTTPGNAQTKKETTANAITEQGPTSKITIQLDGRSMDFDLAYNGQSILDAALQIGADLPYACKGGVCCTCRAKLLQGTVQMEVNYALEPEEVAQGFILTCQAHPTSENIIIDFDVK